MARKPELSITEMFEERARAGDGAYAVAFALLKLADVQDTARASLSISNLERTNALEQIATGPTKVMPFDLARYAM